MFRINSLQSINSQLDGLLSQLKRNESKLFSEYSKVKQSASEFEFKIKSLEAVVIEGSSLKILFTF